MTGEANSGYAKHANRRSVSELGGFEVLASPRVTELGGFVALASFID